MIAVLPPVQADPLPVASEHDDTKPQAHLRAEAPLLVARKLAKPTPVGEGVRVEMVASLQVLGWVPRLEGQAPDGGWDVAG